MVYNVDDMRTLAGLPHFLAVAEAGGFRAAARRLGVTPASVSQAVAGLEARLGVTLVTRSTRSVRLTEAGQRLRNAGTQAQSILLQAAGSLCGDATEPTGALRLCIGRSAMSVVAGAIATYLERHRHVELEVDVREGAFDILSEGFDAGVRIGEFIAPDMVAVRLRRPVQWVVAGSPAYLQGRPPLMSPGDLAAHHCIRFRSPGAEHDYQWEFAGRRRAIRPSGRVVANDARMLRLLALASCGLAYIAREVVEADIRSGALHVVLAEWMPGGDDLYLFYPRSGAKQRALRVLIEIVRERLDADLPSVI